MTTTSPPADLRAAILAVIQEHSPEELISRPLQSTDVLDKAANRSGIGRNLGLQQALLTQFSELFRTGYLSWGKDLANPNPPFFHLTDQGNHALETYSRDPGNPSGYFNHINSIGTLNSIAMSYLNEAVSCYCANLVKAGAVMVGGAAESLIIELRDVKVAKLTSLSEPVPNKMKDWRSRTIAVALQRFFESKKQLFPNQLREDFEAYWPPFTHQIRVARNDAGHPVSIEPVTESTVHASLLIFPELAKIQIRLLTWVNEELT